MTNGLKVLGFMFFGIEILIAAIIGLTFVPWYKLSFLLREESLAVIMLILWNAAGALFLYLGHKEDNR